MTETEPNSGGFLKLNCLNNQWRALSQDDIIEVRYFDQSDKEFKNCMALHHLQIIAKVETQGNNQRIGHEFILRLYEPDANRDSKDEDRISLSNLSLEKVDSSTIIKLYLMQILHS